MTFRAATLFFLATASLAACGSDSPPETNDTVITTAPTTKTPTTMDPATEATATTSALPIGDGRLSTTEPAVGWVYTCVTPRGGGGAFADGPWIDTATDTWDPSQKVHVSGEVTWDHRSSFTTTGDSRGVDTNDLPDHPTGVFPISRDDEAFNYDRNPNSITEQAVSWTLPANPVKADTPRCLNMGAIGVMTPGSVLFNALDAEGRDAAAHETLDNCDGHPEISGAYHYHNLSTCNPAYGSAEPTLVGWAADGFPIVTGQIDGHDATNADLDECHGRDTTIEIDGSPTTTYAYWMTAEYPYSIGCFWGTEIATGD